ncbi:DUF1932 domain-containing protein [Psychromarinibacter sp. C21-152]|uniref:DUF1932 domain-containing protein n=1 Tax=Psychromarinibacter sediminicola TaxID=3033385 RepID=A0AAE3TAV6_9RHOB|nr:DUF1932 domain-containing protein [Psychromarinibacter sediminicola]MDF0603637.1 DUF1932 domain-containing protein [Psychromarinibacter sediminicola]
MRIAFIGMGEAGGALVAGWDGAHPGIRAYDIKTDASTTAGPMWARYERLGIEGAERPAGAVGRAELVFCTVTADQAVAAARAAAPHLARGAWWCDLNSCAPSSKREAAEVIEAAGGRYVDVAVMSPVHPRLNMVPLLISGPHAAEIAPVLEALPMSLRVVEGEVGRASSIKMIRSVMIKGIEALSAECALAAVAAGVADEVIPSLANNYPGTDWSAQIAYNMERALVHGGRRAAEMEEVVKTLSDLGLPASMTEATVRWQRRLSQVDVIPPEAPRETGAVAVAESVLPEFVKSIHK